MPTALPGLLLMRGHPGPRDQAGFSQRRPRTDRAKLRDDPADVNDTRRPRISGERNHEASIMLTILIAVTMGVASVREEIRASSMI